MEGKAVRDAGLFSYASGKGGDGPVKGGVGI